MYPNASVILVISSSTAAYAPSVAGSARLAIRDRAALTTAITPARTTRAVMPWPKAIPIAGASVDS